MPSRHTDQPPEASSSSFSPWLVDRITFRAQACRLRALEGIHLVGLRLLSLLLLRLLLLHLVPPAHAAHHGAGRRTDGRALAGVAPDGTADGADRRASSGAAKRAGRGRRRLRRHLLRHARVDAGLLGRPRLALRLILRLLLGALALLRIDERLPPRRARRKQQR